MKKFLKKILPKEIFFIYHYAMAIFASIFYLNPSSKMVVIGVTGTKGKTSTANYIYSCLSAGGLKTGIISTANIRIGDLESLNNIHMTMPGRFGIQRLMSQMVKAGCKFCVIETTSEGIKQFRHIGIKYDIAVFTNITPEHLPSHNNSFEEYRRMKEKMMNAISNHSKKIDGVVVSKLIIANHDDENVSHFIKYNADKKITYGIKSNCDFKASNIKETIDGVDFDIENNKYHISIPGQFNVYNALPAIAIAHEFGIDNSLILKGLNDLNVIQGRMEKIVEGQDFLVYVDYAHEKQSMTNVLRTANNIKNKDSKVIVALGAEGGGRDKAKRSQMGEVVARLADYVVVTNVDPYDDDPKTILEDIAVVVEKNGKNRNENLFVIEDRREGIRKSLSLAKNGDIVIITGKGAEQSMIIGDKTIPWDDRVVVREEIRKLK